MSSAKPPKVVGSQSVVLLFANGSRERVVSRSKPSFESWASRLLLTLYLLAGLACGAPTTAPDDVGNADAVDDAYDAGAEAPQLVIGSGLGEFSAVQEGATLQLVIGCQGSKHVWVAARTWGLDPERALVTAELTRVVDDLRVAILQVRMNLTSMVGHAEVGELTLVVAEPEPALGEPLVLRVQVRARDGATAVSSRSVELVWGPPGCPGHGA